jgi:hypothetical protein
MLLRLVPAQPDALVNAMASRIGIKHDEAARCSCCWPHRWKNARGR